MVFLPRRTPAFIIPFKPWLKIMRSYRLQTASLALFAVAALPCATHAADIAWAPPIADSGGDTLWSNGLNWSGGSAPADNINDDIAVFSGTSAYNFQPTLDAFTVRSIRGLRFGGASAVGVTLAANSGSVATSGDVAVSSTTITMSDVTGISVGQQITGSRILAGTFVTAVDSVNNTVTISRATSGGTLTGGTNLNFNSSLRIGADGITLLSGTPNVTNLITAPIVLGANQTWHNGTTNRTLQIQGSIYLDNHMLTLTGEAGSTISFNGPQGGDATTRQSIGGTGGIIIDTLGTVSIGAGTNNRMQNSFTGGVTLNSGRLAVQGGNAGGGGGFGGLGTGVLTINGGEIAGGGNIADKPFTISGQVWNADWRFAGGRAIDMGVGAITLGTAAGASRTLTMDGGTYELILGGNISDGTTANNLIITGTSLLRINGHVDLTGNTTFGAGSNVNLGNSGSFTFVIGSDGVNNGLLGDGTVTLDGAFTFDLSGASLAHGNTWSIVASSLAAFYGESFSVTGFDFDGDVWTLAQDEYSSFAFSTATGLLTYSVVPEPAAAALLLGLGALGFVAGRRRRA